MRAQVEVDRSGAGVAGLGGRLPALPALLTALALPGLVACNGPSGSSDGDEAGTETGETSDTSETGETGDGDGDEDSCNFDPCEGEEPGMACIQGSTFPMGQPPGSEVPGTFRPEVEVCVSTFWMDRTKVSWAAYDACVAAGVCTPVETSFPPLPEFEDQLGVFRVNWFQARDYCAFVGKRLPTEAEWERAARAGDQRAWPWGDEPDFECGVHGTLDGEAVCEPCANPDGDGLPLIGQFPAGDSPEGIESLTGYPAEWVMDWYSEDLVIDDRSDWSGPPEGTRRITKGTTNNCIISLPDVLPMWSLGASLPDYNLDDVGFRCVKPLGSAGDSSPSEPQVHEGNH